MDTEGRSQRLPPGTLPSADLRPFGVHHSLAPGAGSPRIGTVGQWHQGHGSLAVNAARHAWFGQRRSVGAHVVFGGGSGRFQRSHGNGSRLRTHAAARTGVGST